MVTSEVLVASGSVPRCPLVMPSPPERGELLTFQETAGASAHPLCWRHGQGWCTPPPNPTLLPVLRLPTWAVWELQASSFPASSLVL